MLMRRRLYFLLPDVESARGKVLMMVDVPIRRAQEISALVARTRRRRNEPAVDRVPAFDTAATT